MQKFLVCDLQENDPSLQHVLTQTRFDEELWFVSAKTPHRLEAIVGNGTGLLHPEDAEYLRRLVLHDPLPKGEFDHRREQENGEWLWFRSRLRPLGDHSGWLLQDLSPGGVSCRTRLGATSERLQRAIYSSNAAVWDVDLDREQVYFGPRCYEMLGYDIDTFSPSFTLWYNHVHPEDRPYTIRIIWRQLQRHGRFSVDYRFRREDGEWQWLRCNGQGSYDGSRKLTRITGVHLDIHEQKQLDIQKESERKNSLRKAKLSRSLLQLNSVEEMAEEILKAAMELTGCHSGFVAALPEGGGSPHPVHARGWFARRGLLYRGLRPCWATIWHRGEELILPSFSSMQNLAGVPVNFKTRTEGLLLVGGRDHPFTESDLTILRWLASLYAMGKKHLEMADELEQLRSERSRLNQARQQFLANMSHEIRTPLNGVLGMLILLQMTDLDGEQQEYVDVAERAGNGLMTLLNDFLEFSQLDQNLMVPACLRFRPGEVLAEVLTLYRAELANRGVTFICDLQTSCPEYLWGDPKGLRQIVFNLLGNAVKFTKEGTISLTCCYGARTGEDGLLMLRIQDSGIGIPCEQIETIFEPFGQADGSITRKHQGGGLGLSITRKIIAAMGGDLVFASHLGEGTSVFVRLPLPACEPMKGAAPLLQRRPLQVLLADESTADRQLARWMFEQLGHRPIVRLGEEKTRSALTRLHCDALLIGIVPGDDSALAIIRETRQRGDAGVWMPVVAMVPYGHQELRHRALASGASRVLEKPFSLEQMTRITETLRLAP